MARFTGWIAVLVTAASLGGVARADDRQIAQQLTAYEAEAQKLGSDLPRPNQISGAAGQRRLVDAQVAFSLGNYDSAALMLFDLATKPGPDQETASFYLAESLYQKGDRGAARGYYEHVVAGGNVASRYYQPALERLVEISIAQKDETNLGETLSALDRVPANLRRPSVPYVRGKLAYSQDKLDEAIAYFAEVPKGSEYEMQAAYYTATTYVAKKDLQRATDLFTALLAQKPRSANDRRIVELSQLALGRLYYERDQASKSIDAYLLVDRHSDLFADALYEVGWVYVKNKQFDKALRTLELLSLSDPQSQKTPTVRILEGNLRIRKAQMLRAAQIQGTLDAQEPGNPETEYDRAAKVFSETHDLYMPSYAALAAMANSSANPAQYLTQLAGRTEHVFQAAAPLPEAAIQYLRDEPAVQRVVAVETDLGDITSNLAESEATIARLEGVLAANDRSAVYPAINQRRTRIATIQDDLIKLRSELADKRGGSAAETAKRRELYQRYAALPSAEHVAQERAAQNRAQYNAIGNVADEAGDTIGETQAIAVALRKYAIDTPDLEADRKQQLNTALDQAARDAEAIENELDAVHRELQIGIDLAAVGDDAVPQAREARKQLRLAEDAEANALGAGKGNDFAMRAMTLAARFEAIDGQLDAAVDQGLAEIKTQLAAEKSQLQAFKAELAGYEDEARGIGGTVLAATFATVKDKFYDIVIRTDVGNVDVAWSQKEDNDDDLKRLNLSRQRELKQLKDEFKDILDAGTPKPSAPKKVEMPKSEPPAPSGSPDQGAPDQRVTPGSDKPATSAQPTVKPGSEAPKKPAAKGGSK